MTSMATERGGPSLLSLPNEVRSIIFSFLFKGAVIRASSYPDEPTSLDAVAFPWQITATCHSIRQSTLPLLGQATLLEYSGSGNLGAIEDVLPWTYRQHVSSIRVPLSEDVLPTHLLPALRSVIVDNEYEYNQCVLRVASENDVLQALHCDGMGKNQVVDIVMREDGVSLMDMARRWRSGRPSDSLLDIQVRVSVRLALDWQRVFDIYPDADHSNFDRDLNGATDFVSYQLSTFTAPLPSCVADVSDLQEMAFDLDTGRVIAGFDHIDEASEYMRDVILCGIDLKKCGHIKERDEAERTACVLYSAFNMAFVEAVGNAGTPPGFSDGYPEWTEDHGEVFRDSAFINALMGMMP